MEFPLGGNLGGQHRSPDIKRDKLPCVFNIQISPEEYTLLTTKLKFSEPKKISYIYFDTSKSSKEAKLFNKKIRLRVKTKGEQHFLELKDRGENKSELCYEISNQDFEAIHLGIIPEGSIRNKLAELRILSPIQIIDTTNSTRQKIIFHEGKLFIDQTTTGADNKISYQVEFRSQKPFSVEEINRIITEELGISHNPVTKTKLQKFWEGR